MDSGASPSEEQCVAARPSSPDNAAENGWIDFLSDLISSCTDCVSKSNALPVQSDYTYHDAFPTFRSEIATLKSMLLSSITQLINSVDKDNDFSEVNDDTDRFRCLTEATDMVLERVDMMLHARPTHDNIVVKNVGDNLSAKKSHRSLQIRPQSQFKEPVDNSDSPWRPVLNYPLPNHRSSVSSLQQDPIAPSPKLEPEMMSHIGSLGINADKPSHPYKIELESLTFSHDRLCPQAEQLYKSLEETPYTWVDSEECLRQLADVLSNESEFAIDLEHHSFRSYLGFTCLMQISTRSHDYVIDTIQLRHCMGVLLDPFTNPAILKVLHGADYDVCWLQKDFSLYIVNMFDTGQASRVLQLPSASLKYLLEEYCDVQTSKAFQRADWRMRPIPAPMIKYARSDTHYLLYIYDCMRNQLCEQSTGALLSVYERSRRICLKTFEKPVCTQQSYTKLIQQFDLVLDPRQESVLRDLYCWRDTLARQLDESCGFILPNAMLISISLAIPTDKQSILEIAPTLSPPVQERIEEVLFLISKALENLPSESDSVLNLHYNVADKTPAVPNVLVLDKPILSTSSGQAHSSSSFPKIQSIASVESASRSSCRMFDSDSDEDSSENTVKAAEAVKMQILHSLKARSIPTSDHPQNELTSANPDPSSSMESTLDFSNVSTETGIQNVKLPESVKGHPESKSPILTLNEIRHGPARKRKSQPAVEPSMRNVADVEHFDYEKAIESATSGSTNENVSNKNFDFFRGPAVKRNKSDHNRR